MSKKRTCRVCGCHQRHACITKAGPCHWVEKDLCSNPDCIANAAMADEVARITCAPTPHQEITNAIRLKAAAKEKLRKAMVAAYPVGTRIHWYTHNRGQRHLQIGVVITSGAYLRATNSRTGKTVSVGFYDMHGLVA